jgi:hypothetical protein
MSSKKIEETLNLPSMEDLLKSLEEDNEPLQKIENEQDIIENHDNEMNDIMKKAMTSYESLMDLGFNAETRVAGEIFGAAVNMLKLSTDASRSKMEQKFKKIKLELEAKKIDYVVGKDNKSIENNQYQGKDVIIMNRNDLLKSIKDDAK